MVTRLAQASLAAALVLAAGCGTTVPLASQGSQAPTDGLVGSSQAGTSGDPASPAAPTSDGLGSSTAAPSGPTSGISKTGGTVSAPGRQTGGTTVSGTIAAGSGASTVSDGSSGFGWDAKHFYIGMPTANDAAAAFKAAGANFDNGDVVGDVNAVVADINRSGGVLGRQLVPVFHDVKTADVLSNPAQSAQEVCTYFTQDRPVIAVFNGVPQFDAADNFHTCLEGKHVTLLSATNTLYSDQDYQHLGPHLWTMLSLSTDLLVPTFLDALERQHFFTGWDTSSGKPGSAPVRVGILLPDDRTGHYVHALMENRLKALGRKADASFFYGTTQGGASTQSAVLQFKAASITHVLDLPPIEADIGLFQQNSEQQHYRPRHAFTSFNIPLSIEENSTLAPPAQQVGSIGIGFQPSNDTDARNRPGHLPGYQRCIAALKQGGQTFDASHLHAEGVALEICDAFYLLRDATADGKGFSPNAILAGMPLPGPAFPAATTFGNGISQSSHGFPGFYRDEHYVTSCSCFQYTSGSRPFHR